ADPTGRIRGLAVGRRHVRIAERGETSFAFGKFTNAAERHPRQVSVPASTRDRGKQKPHDRHGESSSDEYVEENPQLHHKAASGNFVFVGHRLTPTDGCNSKLHTAAPGFALVARPATQLRR